MTVNNVSKLHSRRIFLKTMGLSALALSMGQAIEAAAAEESPNETDVEQFGWLIDLTRCADCGACMQACKEENNLPPTVSAPPELTFNTWTFVETIEVPTTLGKGAVYSVKRQCMHCLEPACASACPVAALHQTPEGAVVYDVSLCMGCRYCMLACPFDIPHFEWNEGLTPVIGKCLLCPNRRVDGLKPACVDICPTGTLEFGSRERMLAIARARLEANPDRYVNHIYGEHEVGGTGVLYLSGIPFEKLGFRTDLTTEPLPELTWNIMTRIPAVAVGMTVGMSGIAAITHRRGKDKTEHQQQGAVGIATPGEASPSESSVEE